MSDYNGKIAVITGGGGGIGHGIALACLKEGIKVVLADINEERLAQNAEKLTSETGGEISTFRMDATCEEDFLKLKAFVLEKYGKVNFLFNNAGVSFHKDFLLLTDTDWEFILRSNLWSVIYGMRTFMPVMEENDDVAYIINTASGAAIRFLDSMSHYSTTKSAVVLLTGAVQREEQLRGGKIQFMAVMPSFVTANLIDSIKDLRVGKWKPDLEEQTASDIEQEKIYYNAVTAPYLHPELFPKAAKRYLSITNEDAGKIILQHIHEGKNFCFTHEGWDDAAVHYGNVLKRGYIKVPHND